MVLELKENQKTLWSKADLLGLRWTEAQPREVNWDLAWYMHPQVDLFSDWTTDFLL
jgi:hypothetical protein